MIADFDMVEKNISGAVRYSQHAARNAGLGNDLHQGPICGK